MALAIRDEVIEELLQGYRSPEDLLGEEGLFKELKKRLLERALGAELTEHLGYENRAPPPGSASETNTICQTKSKLLPSYTGPVPRSGNPPGAHWSPKAWTPYRNQLWSHVSIDNYTDCRRLQ